MTTLVTAPSFVHLGRGVVGRVRGFVLTVPALEALLFMALINAWLGKSRLDILIS